MRKALIPVEAPEGPPHARRNPQVPKTVDETPCCWVIMRRTSVRPRDGEPIRNRTVKVKKHRKIAFGCAGRRNFPVVFPLLAVNSLKEAVWGF
jgi:hypothetical protein